MDDQTTPALEAGTESVAPAVTQPATSDTEAAPGAEPMSLEEAKRLIKVLQKNQQDANKEAQKLRERVKIIDEAAEQDRQAKLTEEQKLKERLAAIENENRALQVAAWKAQAASKHNLGDLSEFLTGDTAEAIEQQAVKLADRLKQAPNITAGATSRGGGNPAPETYNQRMQRIMSGSSGGDVWTNLEAHGGGLFWPGKPDVAE